MTRIQPGILTRKSTALSKKRATGTRNIDKKVYCIKQKKATGYRQEGPCYFSCLCSIKLYIKLCEGLKQNSVEHHNQASYKSVCIRHAVRVSD